MSLAALVSEVEKFKGHQYVFGAAGPNTFDCSGLVQYSLQQLGYKNVPRTSEAQWGWVQKISSSQIQPGDLVFAQFPGDPQASPGHVGVYIGNGQVFSARSPSAGIGIDTLSSWGSAIVGYGRVPGSPSGGTPATTTGFDPLGLGGLVNAFTGFANNFGDMFKIFHDLVSPAFWLRIGMFLAGLLLLAFGVYAFVKADSGEGLMPKNIPVPVPV
jgi:hypothetical protein